MRLMRVYMRASRRGRKANRIRGLQRRSEVQRAGGQTNCIGPFSPSIFRHPCTMFLQSNVPVRLGSQQSLSRVTSSDGLAGGGAQGIRRDRADVLHTLGIRVKPSANCRFTRPGAKRVVLGMYSQLW